ncbi:unnamed protein product [Heligmosomoides polygyrus]|uniref:G_PROTEIN_RECEP_F1_2 domain-containing protein n=1 Tax=Heligmosomoides polygyrus TaxID=6339 RepID=A0A183GAU1_HELPZ|nr:unnamed protein product [Heligmosomoides polygyrus]
MSTGLDPVLLPLTFVFLVLPTIGIIGNGVMVVATFKAKRMNSPCHILIALTCFVDLFHEIGQYPFVYHFLRSTSIMQTDCFWIQLIPMIGACAGSPLILSLGLDRPSTCPPQHPHLRRVQLPLLRLTQGPALTAMEEGRSHNCSVELAFEGPGAYTVAEDPCGLPPLEPGCVYPSPDRLVHTSSLG